MKIIKFPERRQHTTWDCGANALQSVLTYYGLNIREGVIIKESGMTKGGMMVTEMTKYAKKYGIKTKSKKMTIAEIKEYIDKKIPVIIPLQAWTDKKDIDWANDWDDGHYVVAIGYDKTKLFFEDPSSSKRVYLTYEEFETRWHDIDRDGKKYVNYGIAFYGKEPDYFPEKAVKME